MHLTLRQLEVFAAIARRENVSQAARQLALSQSAASSALAELERQFDCPLFDRIGKSLRLNGQGAALLPRADDLLARAEEIENLLAGKTVGRLAVCATLTIGNYLASLIVAEYLRRLPDSQVNFSVANTEAVIDRLVRCQFDLGLVEGEVRHPDLISETWLDDRLVVFCAPGHPLADTARATPTMLTKQRWIVRESGSGTRAVLDRALGPLAGQLDIVLTLEHTEAIKRAVEAGLGIACLSRLSLRDAFRRGSLIEIATPQLDLSRRFLFAWHRQRQPTSAMRAFIALAREMAGQARNTDELILPHFD